MNQNDRELDEIVRIARAAAAIVMDVYATPFTVEMKGPGDPVTRADREANALICSALAEGRSRVQAILQSADVHSTAGVLRALGVVDLVGDADAAMVPRFRNHEAEMQTEHAGPLPERQAACRGSQARRGQPQQARRGLQRIPARLRHGRDGRAPRLHHLIVMRVHALTPWPSGRLIAGASPRAARRGWRPRPGAPS